MVAPVDGPFFTDLSGPFTTGQRKSYRQKPPYDLVLPYSFSRNYGKNTLTVDNDDLYNVNVFGSDLTAAMVPEIASSHPSWVSLRNQAYSRLISKLGPTAGYAENLAQANKSVQTIVSRSLQLQQFALQLRKGDFKRAARTLRTPVPSNVSHKKAVSQNFLEYEYGIAPVISDIRSSIEFFQTDFGTHRISGASRSSASYVEEFYTEGWSTTGQCYSEIEQKLKMFARVRISNPNIFAAKQLGLIDVALPWKLIPFSFVVDWFVNVEQILSSFTDFYGVDLINPGTTTGFVATRRGKIDEIRLPGTWQGGDPSKRNRNTLTIDMSKIRIDRSNGLQGPVFEIKPFQGFSVQRGAQAIALVLAVLGK